MSELIQKLEKAFDYRGDVTLDMQDGSTVEGFLFNFDTKASEPFVELYLKDVPAPSRIPLSKVKDVRLTGEDMAAGKSWEDWQAKREREKQKGIERAAKKAGTEAADAEQHRDLKVF